MGSPSSLEQEFLEKWIKGLQVCSSAKKEMSIFERKNVIKLSADVAMASAKNGRSYWSRALIAKASKNSENKFLVKEILGNNYEIMKKYSSISSSSSNKMALRSKKIVKRSRRVCRVKKMARRSFLESSIIAKKLIKKRTQVLKSLVPGGEFIDEFNLLEETLDYIMSLKAQVDVMKCLANATEHLNCK